jgi:hypothetical protein
MLSRRDWLMLLSGLAGALALDRGRVANERRYDES